MSLNLDYRPTTLEEVFGNDELVDTLTKMIKRSTPRSSYFLTGIPGSGKTTLARVIANELGIDSKFNFHEYNAANTRGIDTIRNIVSEAGSKPLSGKRKMYLLDECHQITGAASEALLKFLEEPPKHVFIALCTSEPSRINSNTLSAIRRRCFCAQLRSIVPPEITKYIRAIADSEEAKVSDNILKQISKNCGGSLGHALSMLDTVLDIEDDETALSMLDKILAEEQVKPIITLLIDERESGPAKWKKISKILKNFDGNPEDARRSIAGYIAKVLQNKEALSKTVPLMKTAVYFTDSFYESGMLGLTMACCQACIDCDVTY